MVRTWFATTWVAASTILGLSRSLAAEIIVVVPPGLNTVEGGTDFFTAAAPSGGFRVQEVHPASDFLDLPAEQHSVVRMAWRPDRRVATPRTWTVERFNLWLSTTNKEPGQLQAKFADNRGEDETLVFSGPIRLETDGAGPAEGPKPFDYAIEFQTPFFYDPGQGNLLVEYSFGGSIHAIPAPAVDGVVPSPRLVRGLGGYGESARTAGITVIDVTVKEFAFSPPPTLQAGDADQDLDFDQFDLIQVQQAAKYLTGDPATWGEGDWNGAPGGGPGNPPAGDGLFDQLDIVAALAPGHYQAGTYAAMAAVSPPSLGLAEGQTSVVDQADSAIIRAAFGDSFGLIGFDPVAQPGLSKGFVASDPSVADSLVGGRTLGEVDLTYVPEPAALVLFAFGLAGLVARGGQRCRIRRTG